MKTEAPHNTPVEARLRRWGAVPAVPARRPSPSFVSHRNMWRSLQLGLFFMALLIGVGIPIMPTQSVQPTSWPGFLFVLPFGIGGNVLLLWLQRRMQHSVQAWQRPTLSSNPFGFSQPLVSEQFFGIFFSVLGAGQVLRAVTDGVALSLADSMFFVVGIVVLLSLHIFILLFPRHVADL